MAVDTFEADVPYQQDKIVFRTSPYEVNFYEYHKWLRPPEELVADQIEGDAGVAGGPTSSLPGGRLVEAGFDDPPFVDEDQTLVRQAVVVVGPENAMSIVVEDDGGTVLAAVIRGDDY